MHVSIVTYVRRMVKQNTHHHRMYTRVDEDEHPYRRTHIPDPSPHAQHSAGMVVRLQCCAPLALRNDDERIENLVEFADVEHPTPESQTFVP